MIYGDFFCNWLKGALLHNLSASDSESICALLEIWRPKQIAKALSSRSKNFSGGSNITEDEQLKLSNKG